MPERYDERLRALREQMAQARKQEAMLRELIIQQDELAAKTGELARQLQLEQEYRAILDKKVAAMKEFGLEAEKIAGGVGKLHAAVCPACGEVSLYLEDTEKLDNRK